jgi:hypothetical protein
MQKVAGPVSSRTAAFLKQLLASQPSAALKAPVTFLAALTLSAELNSDYGAPNMTWVNYTVDAFGRTSTPLGDATDR